MIAPVGPVLAPLRGTLTSFVSACRTGSDGPSVARLNLSSASMRRILASSLRSSAVDGPLGASASLAFVTLYCLSLFIQNQAIMGSPPN
ncbi:hypothetical protein CW304_32120 [Bacillus sp. UFRGS-B20]|nr:hypothetical protein CW304_32120 [Bacillus sp. UFRGS-B20]